MKFVSVILIATCVTILVTTGHAQPSPQPNLFSANNLMKGCRSFLAGKWESTDTRDDAFIRGVCVGTVTTLVATAEAIGTTTGVCRPEQATISQQVRVVVTYIDARPNRFHEDLRVLSMEALRDAWPCKR